MGIMPFWLLEMHSARQLTPIYISEQLNWASTFRWSTTPASSVRLAAADCRCIDSVRWFPFPFGPKNGSRTVSTKKSIKTVRAACIHWCWSISKSSSVRRKISLRIRKSMNLLDLWPLRSVFRNLWKSRRRSRKEHMAKIPNALDWQGWAIVIRGFMLDRWVNFSMRKWGLLCIVLWSVLKSCIRCRSKCTNISD